MPKRHLLATSSTASRRCLATALTQTNFGVCPLEALGKDISYVGQIEQEQWHANDGVDDSYHLADL
jgi:hypothetical protein